MRNAKQGNQQPADSQQPRAQSIKEHPFGANEYITKSASETFALGENIAGELAPGDIVLLFGNLGSGKTCLTQGLAKGLGIAEQINSPTYIYIHSYILNLVRKIPISKSLRRGGPKKPQISNSKSARHSDSLDTKYQILDTATSFHHIDLYRVESPEKLITIGIEDLLLDHNNVLIIEWPEIIYENLLKGKRRRIEVRLNRIDENTRSINIEINE